MKEKLTKGIIINRASVAGLVLGGVSAVYMLAVQYIPQIISSNLATSLITTTLWTVKFVGCILIMKAFMQHLANSYEDVKRQHSLSLGIWSALFSALIVSATSLADTLYINPEAIDEAIDMVIGTYAQMIDSNTLTAIEEVKGMLPSISFFSNLIYCFLYGAVLSVILSSYIPKKDPFAEFHKEFDENGTNDENGIDEQ